MTFLFYISPHAFQTKQCIASIGFSTRSKIRPSWWLAHETRTWESHFHFAFIFPWRLFTWPSVLFAICWDSVMQHLEHATLGARNWPTRVARSSKWIKRRQYSQATTFFSHCVLACRSHWGHVTWKLLVVEAIQFLISCFLVLALVASRTRTRLAPRETDRVASHGRTNVEWTPVCSATQRTVRSVLVFRALHPFFFDSG